MELAKLSSKGQLFIPASSHISSKRKKNEFDIISEYTYKTQKTDIVNWYIG